MNIDSPSIFVHSDELDSRTSDIDFSKDHGVLVTDQGTLYTWGINMYNKLGHIQEIVENTPYKRKIPRGGHELVKFSKITLPENKKAISAKCGYNHTICLDEDGNVYSWGYGKDGALGHQDYENVSHPQKIKYFEENKIKIIKIESGDYFTMALCNQGKIYTWGQNNYGQLGLGKVSQQIKVNKPTKVNFSNKTQVKEIFAGEDHCACITEDAEGFVWGYGLDGRLGNRRKMNQNVPVKLGLDKIKKISCGGHHTAILTVNGELYMCGNGRDGELGRGDLLESQSVIRDEALIVINIFT